MIPLLPPDGDVTSALGHLHTIVLETGAGEVRPEHMLFAMARYAPDALRLRCDPIRLEEALHPVIEAGRPEEAGERGETPYSEVGQRILQRAMADAEGQGASSWGIDHLLGAVVAESPKAILDALREAGMIHPDTGPDGSEA